MEYLTCCAEDHFDRVCWICLIFSVRDDEGVENERSVIVVNTLDRVANFAEDC